MEMLFAAILAAVFVMAVVGYPVLPACVLLTSSKPEYNFLSPPRRKKGKMDQWNRELIRKFNEHARDHHDNYETVMFTIQLQRCARDALNFFA
jgi:hypothetical protein